MKRIFLTILIALVASSCNQDPPCLKMYDQVPFYHHTSDTCIFKEPKKVLARALIANDEQTRVRAYYDLCYFTDPDGRYSFHLTAEDKSVRQGCLFLIKYSLCVSPHLVNSGEIEFWLLYRSVKKLQDPELYELVRKYNKLNDCKKDTLCDEVKTSQMLFGSQGLCKMTLMELENEVKSK